MSKTFHIELQRKGNRTIEVGGPSEGDFRFDMKVGDFVRFHTSENGTVRVDNFIPLNSGLKLENGKPAPPDLPFGNDIRSVGGDVDLKIVNSCKAMWTSHIDFADGTEAFCDPATTVCTGGGNTPVVCH